MGMSAYENVWTVGVDELEGLVVISSRETAYVHHENPFSLTLYQLCIFCKVPHIIGIAVAENSCQGLESGNISECIKVAEIPGVPDNIYRLEKFPYIIRKRAMSV